VRGVLLTLNEKLGKELLWKELDGIKDDELEDEISSFLFEFEFEFEFPFPFDIKLKNGIGGEKNLGLGFPFESNGPNNCPLWVTLISSINFSWIKKVWRVPPPSTSRN